MSASVLTRARHAWPTLALADDLFLTHLTERAASPEHAHIEDLYLAAACLHGVPGALALFDSHVLPRIDPVVRRIDPDDAFLDDVKQLVRERLFLPPPRISEYSGQGPLVAWLRAAAARIALNHLRPEKRHLRAATDELDALPLAAPDPALALLQGRHRAVFREAFQAALAALPVRERTALKLNALDGVSLEKIGAMYGHDKSTVSRWLAHAHDTLLAHTRAHLITTLHVPSSEVESLIHALQSQLAPSLVNLLNE